MVHRKSAASMLTHAAAEFQNAIFEHHFMGISPVLSVLGVQTELESEVAHLKQALSTEQACNGSGAYRKQRG